MIIYLYIRYFICLFDVCSYYTECSVIYSHMMESDKVQLNFISARAPTKLSAPDDNNNMIVDLREYHDLIKPSEHDTWAGTMVTPLRDRWVCHDVYCYYGDDC